LIFKKAFSQKRAGLYHDLWTLNSNLKWDI
jgi:hypothetical protein